MMGKDGGNKVPRRLARRVLHDRPSYTFFPIVAID